MWNFFSRSHGQIITRSCARWPSRVGLAGSFTRSKRGTSGPPRCSRGLEAPGASVRAVRQDHTLKCYGGKTIVFSLWTIQDDVATATAQATNPRPAVLYLHSAVGGRPEALQALHTALRAGANFCALDFQGSGLSEGDIVTWGWCENNDVVDVVKFLLNKVKVKKLALWGRQLGAATAMTYAARDPRIACLILDTPYSSLDDQMDLVVTQAQKEGMSVPSIVLKAATKMLKRSVRKRIAKKFDPNKLAPKRFASKCKCPALFAGDTKDGVVPPAMVKTVFNKYNKQRRHIVDFTCEGSGHFGSGQRRSCKHAARSCAPICTTGRRACPETWPDVSDPTFVAAGAEWPPKWTVKLHLKVEINRAMWLKEWTEKNAAEGGGATNPAGPRNCRDRGHERGGQRGGFGRCLAEFEEMAAGGAGVEGKARASTRRWAAPTREPCTSFKNKRMALWLCLCV